MQRRFKLLVIPALALTSCSHYYLPANRMETPETTGTGGRTGRLELLGIQGGPDLQADPLTEAQDPGATGPPTKVLQNSNGNVFFGFTPTIWDKVDVGVRFQPSAPLIVRGKYQFYGQPENKADKGNLSAAVMGAGGLLLAGKNDTTGNSVTYTNFDFALLGGWRPWRRHLFSFGPGYTIGSLSGTTTAGVSASQLEINLGYQYSNEALFLRAELAYTTGSSGENKIKGIFPGALLGFSF